MKKRGYPMFLALAFAFAACNSPIGFIGGISGNPGGTGDNNQTLSTTYTATNDGVLYTLIVTSLPARAAAGDEYELTVESPTSVKTSKGTIESVEQNNLKLKPNNKNSQSFTLIVSEMKIIFLTGNVTFIDGTTTPGPGSFPTGGDNNQGSNQQTITSVTVSPPTATVAKGASRQFTATVTGTNNPVQTVTWSIVQTNKHSATAISASGLLTVSANEALSTLTIRAISTADTTKRGDAAVTVTTPGSSAITLDVRQITEGAPIINAITISRTGSNAIPVTFTVSVNASDYDAGSITWEIAGVGSYAGQTVTGAGPSFTLNAGDVRYNSLGGHALTVRVAKGGLQYQRTIPFTIVN